MILPALSFRVKILLFRDLERTETVPPKPVCTFADIINSDLADDYYVKLLTSVQFLPHKGYHRFGMSRTWAADTSCTRLCYHKPHNVSATRIAKWLHYNILRLQSIECPPQLDSHNGFKMLLERVFFLNKKQSKRQHLSRRRIHTDNEDCLFVTSCSDELVNVVYSYIIKSLYVWCA